MRCVQNGCKKEKHFWLTRVIFCLWYLLYHIFSFVDFNINYICNWLIWTSFCSWTTQFYFEIFGKRYRIQNKLHIKNCLIIIEYLSIFIFLLNKIMDLIIVLYRNKYYLSFCNIQPEKNILNKHFYTLSYILWIKCIFNFYIWTLLKTNKLFLIILNVYACFIL